MWQMKTIGFPFLESEHGRLTHNDKTDVNNVSPGNLKIIGLTQNYRIREKGGENVSINFPMSHGTKQRGGVRSFYATAGEKFPIVPNNAAEFFLVAQYPTIPVE